MVPTLEAYQITTKRSRKSSYLRTYLPDLVFVKSTQKNKPEQLIALSTQVNALNAHAESIC